jgi:hypothetical protein
MSRREFDDTDKPCSREYRSGVTLDLPPNDRKKPMNDAEKQPKRLDGQSAKSHRA